MNGETPAEAAPATQIEQPFADRAAEECATCGQPLSATGRGTVPAIATSSARFVYGVGRLRAEFPDTGVAQEFAQLTGVDSRAMVRTEDLKDALSRPESRYLARQICWMFSGPGGDVCTVHPRDGDDLDELIDLLASDDEDVVEALVGGLDEDVVEALVGGPVAPQFLASCTTPGLPAVTPDQVLRFTFDEFVRAMPAPDVKADEEDAYRKVVRDLFAQLTQRGGNVGVSDEHRALNMLALRYPQLYHLAFRVLGEGKALVGVDARGDIAGDRRVVAVRLVFRDARSHLVERYHCSVDVTDLFPFLTSSLSQTFD